jgi:uncharacterized membrane protein
MAGDRGWTDRRMDIVVGNPLRSGVVLSAPIVFLGAVIYLARHGSSHADYRVFRGEPSDLRTVGGIVRQVIAVRGRGIIQLGLLFLIATPVVRVAFSIFGFAEEEDRLYVVIASVVLLVLAYSLIESAWSA